MNRLVLVDGNAIMHRAYHALPPLSDPTGRPVHVVYGFLSVLIRLFGDLKPTHMAVAFDRPGPTFRNELLPTYQAQRPTMEDDFIQQIPIVHEAVQSFGVPMYECDGFEADDVIGTVAQQAVVHGGPIDEVIIVTGDRDILQLVRDGSVFVYMPTKGLSEGALYGEKEVRERMGVPPEKVADLKALMGDPSDNYAGVDGIGPKTATALLEQFGTLERVYAEAEHIQSSRVREKIIAGKDAAFLGKKLATIRTDAPVQFDEAAARIQTLDTPEGRTFLSGLHFPSLMKRLHPDSGIDPSEAPSTRKQRHHSADQQELF